MSKNEPVVLVQIRAFEKPLYRQSAFQHQQATASQVRHAPALLARYQCEGLGDVLQ